MTTLKPSRVPLIVGDGRLARHWKHYLKLNHLSFLQWNRSDSVSFSTFARLHAEQISCVYVLISDSVIEPFYLQHRDVLPSGIAWFHASGASVLNGMIDAHPLMTFSLNLYEDLKVYQSLSFVTTYDIQDLEPLLGNLKNKVIQISPKQKPLYHALCVLGAAGTGALWAMLEDEWRKLGIEPASWHVYQDQVFSNLLREGKRGITGPWVRGDKDTTLKNQNALSPMAKELYVLLKGIFDEHAQH